MTKLPVKMIAEIRGLDGMRARELRKRYARYLEDMPNCRMASLLASVIAYRMQAEHYGIGLSEETKAWLEKPDSGEKMQCDGQSVGAGARFVRMWKGERHEVNVLGPDRYEHRGTIYKSLSAVARAITGTQWNGKIFFGVK